FTEAFRFRELVDFPRDGEELRALDVAALGVRDLPRRRAAGLFAAEQVWEKDGAILRDHTVRPLPGRLHLESRTFVDGGGVSEVFVRELHLGMAPRARRVTEPKRDVDALQRARVRLTADARDVRPLLQPFAVEHVHGGIGAAGHDVGAAVDVARARHRLDLDVEALADLARVLLAVLFGRAVHLDAPDFTRQQKRLGVRPGHAARAEHADDPRFFLRHILRADAGVGADAHVLEVAVVHECQRLAVVDAREQNEAAEFSRHDAVFFLRAHAFVFLLVDDVGFHADCEITRYRTALHGAPLVDFLGIARRDLHVDARPAHGVLTRELGVRGFQRPHGNVHREDAADVVVIEDQHALKILAPQVR